MNSLRSPIVILAVFWGLLIGSYLASGWMAMVVVGGAWFVFAIGFTVGFFMGHHEGELSMGETWAKSEVDRLENPSLREMRRTAREMRRTGIWN